MANEATPTAKPWWQSKTIFLNVLALVAMMVPAVREWVEKNPVEPIAVLSALNLLVRFVTSGRISIFPDGDGDGGAGSSPEGSPRTGVPGAARSEGNGGGVLGSLAAADDRDTPGFPWLVSPACLLLLLASCTVGVDAEGGWSIRPDPMTIDAGLKYLIRHEQDEDGSKAGLTQWKYYDPATGKEIPEEDYAQWGIKP